MKKSIIIAVLMALAIGGFAQVIPNHDFSAVCETGQTLYYRITNEVEHTVALSYPCSEENPWFAGVYYDGFTSPQGEIIIPSIVTYNDIEYSVTAIDHHALYQCELTGTLTIPEGVVSIGYCSFSFGGFTSVFIPQSVSFIDPSPVTYCYSLESIVVDEANPTFYSEDNVIIRREDMALVAGCKTSAIPDGVKIICSHAFQGAGDGGDLIIPSSVRTIGESAFFQCQFSGSIHLSEGLETVEPYAFTQSSFSGSLTIPNSVTEIGHNAFQICLRLTGNLTISTSLTTINNCAFAATPFTGTLVIPNSVEHIGVLVFRNACFDEIYSLNAVPPTIDSNSYTFTGIDPNIPIHIPFGCTEVYQNAEGWNYFSNFIEEEPILYTDFEPDLCVSWVSVPYPLDTIKIDFDQDGTIDFKVFLSWRSTGEIAIDMISSWEHRYKAFDNDSIVPSDEVYPSIHYWLTPNYPWQYMFIDTTHLEDYIGFRKTINGEYYYAWVSVHADKQHTSSSNKVWAYVDRVAYCTIPDYPLRWGQTSLYSIGLEGAEWYYEILNNDGSITYQHLECVGDTVMMSAGGKRPKIIVRSNTHYDRSEITEVTHEYLYEEDGVVYWWNKDLQEFTTLYNLNANVGDEWEIKVGTQSITMHVDTVDYYEYNGKTLRMLRVSDPEGIFNGNIVCGIGHFTSFFPENLMTRGKGYRVEGMRCYWLNGDLMMKLGEKDCDEIYNQYHFGLDETDDAAFAVYPNPATGVLFVETSQPEQTYRLTNLMGQTLLQGHITAETQQIDISNLSTGMYFISMGEQTVKFVKQ